MKIALVNVAVFLGLFLVLILPVGYVVFTDPVASVVSQAASWIGIGRNAEPGDSLVNSVFLISSLLAMAGVCLASAFIKRRKRRHPHVE